MTQPTNIDLLPLITRLTGLSERRVEKAMAELAAKGFITLDKLQDGSIGITLCDLHKI